MVDKIKLKWIYILSAAFIGLNIFFIINEFYWFSLLPVVLLLVILFFFALDRLLLIITFLTPIAINLKDVDNNLALSMPTEPLLFGVLCLFMIKIFFSRELFPARFVKHPVTIAIAFYLIWMFITSITSELPIISFKYLLSRLWFIVPCYFLLGLAFRKFRFIKTFVWLYVITLIGVIVYSTFNLIKWGFDENAAHWVMTPFYNDHTAYGAAISFFVPVVGGFLFSKRILKTERFFLGIALVALLTGLVLSYSRAAWIGVLGALVIALLFAFKIKFRWILLTVVLLAGLFYLYEQQIVWRMEKNKQDASLNIAKHVQSISNISSDASNLERINRWNSAFRMFGLRPVFGWGPGTYQFLYAPYQHSKERTIISTNAGDRGNAHSEYIGPLTEEGVLGLVTVLGIVITAIWTAVKVYKKSASREVRLYGLLFMLGLITYFIHGTLNNFLDTDKSSVPFWGFLAVLVALDVFQEKKSAVAEPILPSTDQMKDSEEKQVNA